MGPVATKDATRRLTRCKMVSERLSEITLGDGLSAVYTIHASIKGKSSVMKPPAKLPSLSHTTTVPAKVSSTTTRNIRVAEPIHDDRQVETSLWKR